MNSLGRILLVGAAGQLGRELRRSFAGVGQTLCYDRTAVDLSDETQVRAMVRAAEPDLILNAAAYTAVDRAESEPDLARAVNTRTPRILAEEAARRNILIVHYSTDYVFNGNSHRPWIETDSPAPLNVYGASKLDGEIAIREVGGKHLIFRTSWVYGPHGNNFLLTMLRLGRERPRLRVVDDQFGAPTTSISLADATRLAAERALSGQCGATHDWSGLYHMTCSGFTSWYGFARTIFDRIRSSNHSCSPEVAPVPTEEYPTAALRPRYSVLSNAKLFNTFRLQLPPWESALDSALSQLQPARPELSLAD